MKGFDIGKVSFKENDKERNLRESFIPAVKDGLQWSGRANVQSPAPPQTIHVDLKISSEQTKYGSQRLIKVRINCTVQNAVTNILFLYFFLVVTCTGQTSPTHIFQEKDQQGRSRVPIFI